MESVDYANQSNRGLFSQRHFLVTTGHRGRHAKQDSESAARAGSSSGARDEQTLVPWNDSLKPPSIRYRTGCSAAKLITELISLSEKIGSSGWIRTSNPPVNRRPRKK